MIWQIIFFLISIQLAFSYELVIPKKKPDILCLFIIPQKKPTEDQNKIAIHLDKFDKLIEQYLEIIRE